MPTPDFISRAARFFVLAEQTSRLQFWLDKTFWGLSASLVVETAPHLPAMVAAVKTVAPPRQDILWNIAHHPLPDVLPPEAVPWYNRLVAAWEVHRASKDKFLQGLARLALVRLDGCGMPEGQERPSGLREWLAEAQEIASGAWQMANDRDPYWESDALAALATWHPAPRVVTPPETLRKWVDFWLEVGRSDTPLKKGIAAIALLNLPEADLQAASIPPIPTAQLLRQLTTSIQSTVERTDPYYLRLLDWQPVKATNRSVAEVRKVVQTWLEATWHKDWMNRCKAWEQLIRWDRAGSLALCGMDLLPELVKAVPTEENDKVLWQMARWVPIAGRFTATETPDRFSLLRQLESAWERHRASWCSSNRASGWLAGIRLHQAGLASESPESFLKAYIPQVAGEQFEIALLALAQWSPGAGAPGRWHRDWHKAWQERLLNERKSIRQIAAWAFLRQFLEMEHGRSLRGVALALWRAEVKVSPEAKHILDAAFARLQEVQAHLAAGEVPDFRKKPSPPAERCHLPLALPPGRIAGSEWNMENEEWKMENEEWKMKRQEATPNLRLVPDCLSR